MKVVAFNGSARKNGNTAILVNHVFQELQKQGIETEPVQLAGKKIQVEHGFRLGQRRCGKRRRRSGYHEGSWGKYGLAVKENSRLIHGHSSPDFSPVRAVQGFND